MKRIFYFIAFILLLLILTSLYVSASDLFIEPPRNLSVRQVTTDDGRRGLLLEFNATETVKQLGREAANKGDYLYYEIECKVAGYDWVSVGYMDLAQGERCFINDTDNPVDLEKYLYTFRIRFVYYKAQSDGTYFPHYSLYSNLAHIGNRSALGTYKNASTWAVQEPDRALEYNLITDRIKDGMNSPITREEICEVIMALYENMAGKVETSKTGIFTDTQNPQVYKANELGIVYGVGNNRFDPDALTNREQVATMIYRAIKVLVPNVIFRPTVRKASRTKRPYQNGHWNLLCS